MALTGAARTAAAEPHEISSINLLVVNHARVDREILEHAQLETKRIYARIGLRLVWIDSAATSIQAIAETNEPNTLGLTIMIVPDAMSTLKNRAGNVMGLARRPTEGRGTVAHVFYQRIQNFAWRAEIRVTQALGHVMAHEIGHLLLPANSHSPTGIMRAHSDRLHMHRVARGLETFTAEQAELIRRSAENRH